MRSYVVILLIAVFAAVTMSEASPPDPLMQNLKPCVEENKITEKEFMDFTNTDMEASKVSNNIKCTIKCLMVKNGFMNEAGKFDAEVFKSKYAHLDSAKTKASLEKCKSIEDPNQCEKAYKITDCLFDDQP